MRTGTLLLAVLTLVVAAMLVAAGCTTTPSGNQTNTTGTNATTSNGTAAATTTCAACAARANQTTDANVTPANTSVTNTTAANITAPFVNATWRWVGKSGSETIQVSNPNQYTIMFAQNGTYAIRADCNTGSGNYTVNGTKVKINPGPLTRAYCGDRSLDQKYLNSLYRVTSYIMDASGNLVLIMVNPNERLIFERVRLAGVRG